MRGLTYRELLNDIKSLELEHLDDTVSIYIPWDDEYFELSEMTFATKENDVLDIEHPILYVKE